MDITKGSSQTSIAWNSLATTSSETYYITKWVSPPLVATTISANTWTFNYGAAESNASANFVGVYTYLYVWRPSTGTRVGFIVQTTPAGQAEPSAINTEKLENVTISGSAVTCQSGDVLILEFWARITQASATSFTDTIYFDGATESSAATNTTVSDLAAYVSTPQTLNFYNSYSIAEPSLSISLVLSRNAIKKASENVGTITEHVKCIDTKTAMTTSLSASSVTTKTRIVPRTMSEPSLSISATVTKKRISTISQSLSISEKVNIKATKKQISEAIGSITEHVTKIPIRNILTSLSISDKVTKRALLKALTTNYPITEHVSTFNSRLLTTSLAIGMTLTKQAIRAITEAVGTIADLIDVSVTTTHTKSAHIIEPPLSVSDKITSHGTKTPIIDNLAVSSFVMKT